VTGAPPCFYGDVAGNVNGIHPNLGAGREGLPFIAISGGFSIGNDWEGELPQTGNSFQWADSLTKISGNHTMKFGVDFRKQQFNQFYYYNVNGEFNYYGGGPNDVGATNLFPNFLLGLPDTFGEGSAQNEAVRNTGLYLYAQDSWKIRPNLTLNYGLRWELNTPLADKFQARRDFPPRPIVDGVPLRRSQYRLHVARRGRIGGSGRLGCSSGHDPDLLQGVCSAHRHCLESGQFGQDQHSRGWGLFYNPIEQLVLAQFGAEPPFGGSTFVSETQFNLPFLGQDGATTYLNPFNGVISPPRGNMQDWAVFEPIDLYGDFQPHMRTQYSAQYNLTIERELSRDMKLEVGYVGSQGHRLLATHDINYSNPQTCQSRH
jgi:hypothetical protein